MVIRYVYFNPSIDSDRKWRTFSVITSLEGQCQVSFLQCSSINKHDHSRWKCRNARHLAVRMKQLLRRKHLVENGIPLDRREKGLWPVIAVEMNQLKPKVMGTFLRQAWLRMWVILVMFLSMMGAVKWNSGAKTLASYQKLLLIYQTSHQRQ